MPLDAVIVAIVASVITGAISSLATVKALGVHIIYLRENLQRVEKMAERAHSRIDEIPIVGSMCK